MKWEKKENKVNNGIVIMNMYHNNKIKIYINIIMRLIEDLVVIDITVYKQTLYEKILCVDYRTDCEYNDIKNMILPESEYLCLERKWHNGIKTMIESELKANNIKKKLFLYGGI